MIRSSVLLLIALGFLLALREFDGDCARAGGKKSPAPITKPGEYKLYDGKVVVKVLEENGLLDFEIKITFNADYNTTIRADKKLKKEDAVWVIHAESSTKVRFLWGPAQRQKERAVVSFMISSHEVKEVKGATGHLSEHFFVPAENVIASLPTVMAEALPKESVEKLKGKN